MINFIPLEREAQLTEILDISNKPHVRGVLLFKHSTRCAVSNFAWRGLRADWKYDEHELPVYYLDLLKHRTLSNLIAENYGVRHESPQLLYVKNEACVGNASHNEVSIETIEGWLDE